MISEEIRQHYSKIGRKGGNASAKKLSKKQMKEKMTAMSKKAVISRTLKSKKKKKLSTFDTRAG